MSDIKYGKVKFFNDTKGFGFIKPEEGGKEIFFHKSGIAEGQKIRDNDCVTYYEEDGKRGPIAVQVEIEADQD